jgi:hypothetical protein
VALLALDGRYLADEGLSTDPIWGVIAISGIYDLNAIPGFNAVFGADPQARREQGGEVQSSEIPYRDHVTIVGFIGQLGDPTTEAILDFLRAHLVS